MFSLRNLMIFGGQGRTYPSSGYCKLLKTKSTRAGSAFTNSNCIPSKNNQLVVYKNNNNRKKWKFKTSSFDEENGKFCFYEGTNQLLFSSVLEGPSLKEAPVRGKNIPTEPPERPSLAEVTLRTKIFEKYGRSSFATSTTQSACGVYNQNHPQGSLAITKRIPMHLNEDMFFNQIRRGLHTSESHLATTKKTGKVPPPPKTYSDPWLTLEGYRIFPWSISGLETSVVVKAEKDKKLAVTFDLGYSTRPSVRCRHVFISHGHMDHVSGLFQHATKRNLYNLPPAVYYVPPNLVETLQKVGQQLYSLTGTPDALLNLDIRPIQPGDSVLVSPDYEIRPFQTFHRVSSQGYLLYHRYKRVKPLYQHLKSKEIAEMENQHGEEKIHEISWIPELAYTGDTTFELFLNEPPSDLFKVRVLILEATYLESITPGIVHKARERGHTHISEIFDNAHLFADIEKLVLIHMSDKYSSNFAREAVSFQMPPSLLQKVVMATLAKDRT